MVKLEGRLIADGYVVWEHNGIISLISEGKLNQLQDNNLFPDTILVQEYNKYSEVKLPTKVDNLKYSERKDNWFLGKEYQIFDLRTYFNLLNEDGEIGRKRIDEELKEYDSHNMNTFLRFCIKLGDFIKNHPDLLLGVGRGSSVSSYLLYLLKIHLVNPIKYDIPVSEFLK